MREIVIVYYRAYALAFWLALLSTAPWVFIGRWSSETKRSTWLIYVIVVREALDYLSMIIGKLIVGVFWSFQWSLAQASRSGLQAGSGSEVTEWVPKGTEQLRLWWGVIIWCDEVYGISVHLFSISGWCVVWVVISAAISCFEIKKVKARLRMEILPVCICLS